MFFPFLLLVCWVHSVCSVSHPLFSSYPEADLSEEDIERATETISDVKIAMTVREVALFEKYLAKATNYFEFGCGGSTILACKVGQSDLSVTSVDSSQQWIDTVKTNEYVVAKDKKGLAQMRTINIGPVGSWGYPTETVEASQGAWYLYSQAISMIDKKYDLVLVDGRFRVACLLQSFISNPTASVMIHDFFEPGHHHAYKALLNVSEVVDRVDTLVALRPKPSVRKEDLMKMYATYMHIPDRRYQR